MAPKNSEADDSEEAAQILQSGARLSRPQVEAWMRSPSLELRAIAFTALAEPDRWGVVLPNELMDEFCLAFLENAIRRNQPGAYAPSRYEAAHDLSAVFHNLWRSDPSAGRLVRIKSALERLCTDPDPNVREATLLGALEHLFTDTQIAAFFADWADRGELAATYHEAQDLGGLWRRQAERPQQE